MQSGAPKGKEGGEASITNNGGAQSCCLSLEEMLF